MNDHVGQQLGNYRLVRLLGQGGFADVYLGEHVHLRTQAAIKILQMRLAEEHAEAFINEARTIAHLVHPNIVRVLDFGVQNGVPFLVMDYAPGGTLRQRMPSGKPLPPAALFPFIAQVASALQYAHQRKLVHRDIKISGWLSSPRAPVLAPLLPEEIWRERRRIWPRSKCRAARVPPATSMHWRSWSMNG
jgi:serine/threonine protein kinase